MKKRSIASFVLGAFALATASCFSIDETVSRPAMVPLTAQVQDWRDEVIYQVLVDRFANGTTGNDWRVDRSSLARYQGGDWQGLIDHMDYFQRLGVTTLWISPIVRNVETDAGIDGYHGYWASDLYELNPHFGDLATLRRLVAEAHRRNLRVVLDIVTNHMGQMFYYDINQNGRPDDNLYGGGMNSGFQNPGGTSSPLMRVSEYDPDYNDRSVIQSFTSLGPAGPAPIIFLNYPDIFRTPPRAEEGSYNSLQWILATPEGYHRRGRIVNYDNVNHQPGDQVMLGDFPGGLKDVATERPEVRRLMIDAYARWVELTDLDGFRIDTLKHVEHEFWVEFAAGVRSRLAQRGKTNFFIFGEAFDGDDQLIGSYTRPGEMDSVFYFSQKFQIFRDIFQCEAPTRNVENLFRERARNFGTTPQPMGANAPPTQLLVNFMDNHDVPRFLAGIFDEDLNSCRGSRVTNRDRNGEDFARMRRKLRAALTYLLTEDGIPCIYYGTELEFDGSNDPSNREVVWERARDYQTAGDLARDFPTDGETFRWIGRLNRLRRAYQPLRRGSFDLRWTTMNTGSEPDAGMLAFERKDGDRAVLVVINAHSAGNGTTSSGGNDMMTSFAPGTRLVDVLNTDMERTFTVGAGGRVAVTLEPWQSVVLVPEDQRQTLPE